MLRAVFGPHPVSQATRRWTTASTLLGWLLSACAQPSVADTTQPAQRGKALGANMSTHFVNPQQAASVPAQAQNNTAPFAGIAARVETNDRHESTVHVQNRGSDELNVSLAVEWAAGAQHASFPSGLRADCAPGRETCLTLAPGAELIPPPWRVTADGKLCQCDRCNTLPNGDAHVIVQRCDKTASIQSDAVPLAGNAQAQK
jgi:hypothetical protein